MLLERAKTKVALETQIEATADKINALKCAHDAIEKSLKYEKQLKREVEKKLMD